jgi:hypothetical protein
MKFKWTVEFEVDESWVANGFDLTDERAKDMIESELPYSYGHETKAKVIKAPLPAQILVVQGYSPKEALKMTKPAA